MQLDPRIRVTLTFLALLIVRALAPATAAPPAERLIAVVGATGHQGGAVARELLARGYKVRALTRSPNKPAAIELVRLGAEIVQADLDDPASLDRALLGVYGVFGVTDYWEHGYKGEVQEGRNLVDAARRARVRHFVFSSVGSADRHTGIPHFESKREIERYLEHANLTFTILRPVAFMDNWNDAPQVLAAGELRDALRPTTRLQLIAVRDIGRFAAEAFDHPQQWRGRELDIAGDQLTLPQVAAELTQMLGHEIKYRQITWKELRSRQGPDGEVMKRWFDAVGYNVDVEALRREFPWMQRFDEFARERFGGVAASQTTKEP